MRYQSSNRWYKIYDHSCTPIKVYFKKPMGWIYPIGHSLSILVAMPLNILLASEKAKTKQNKTKKQNFSSSSMHTKSHPNSWKWYLSPSTFCFQMPFQSCSLVHSFSPILSTHMYYIQYTSTPEFLSCYKFPLNFPLIQLFCHAFGKYLLNACYVPST